MRPRPFPIILACLLSFAPALATSQPLPPAEIVVVDAGGSAIVAWTPAPEAARGDVQYNVYGGRDGAFVLLGSTRGATFSGAGAYDTYAVSAVSDGVESRLAFACIWINPWTLPPQIIYEPKCRIHGSQTPNVLLPTPLRG